MRILVTRPQPGADQTAARLAERGHEAIVLPLSRVAPVAAPVSGEIGRFDAAVASSVNSIRHAPAALVEFLSDLPFHVVGEATAAAVREAGLQVAEIADGAADLSGRITDVMPKGARIAYLCGRVRLPIFQASMASAGFDIHPFEVYDTLQVKLDDMDVLARLGHRPLDAVLLYSALAARSYMELASRPGIAPFLAGLTAYCLSRRIAEEFPQGFTGKRLAACRPLEAALLELVDRNT